MSQERGNRRDDAHSKSQTAATRTMGVQGHGQDTEDDRLLSNLQRVKAADSSKMLFLADHGYVLAGAALCFLMGTMVSLVIVWIIILICNRQIALERIHTQTKIAGVYAEYNFRHPPPKKPYIESLARVFNCTTNTSAILPLPNSDVMKVSNIQTAMALAYEAGMGYTQDIANRSAYSNLFMAIFVAAVAMLLLEVLCIFIFVFCDKDAKEGSPNSDETSAKYSFLIQGPKALHHGVFQVTNSLSNASLQVKNVISKTTERYRTLKLRKQKPSTNGDQDTDDVTEMTINVHKDMVPAHSSTFQPYQPCAWNPESVQSIPAAGCDLDTHVTDLGSRSVGLETLRDHLERRNLLVSATPDLETVDQTQTDDEPRQSVAVGTGQADPRASVPYSIGPQLMSKTSVPMDVTGQPEDPSVGRTSITQTLSSDRTSMSQAPPPGRTSIGQPPPDGRTSIGQPPPGGRTSIPQSDVTAEIRSDLQRRISSTTSAVQRSSLSRQSRDGKIPERLPSWETPVSALRRPSQELINSVAREREFSLTRQSGPAGRTSNSGPSSEQTRQGSILNGTQGSVPFSPRERELSAASERRQREMSMAAAEARRTREREQSASRPSEQRRSGTSPVLTREGSLASGRVTEVSSNPFERPDTPPGPAVDIRGSRTGEFFIPQTVLSGEQPVRQTSSHRGEGPEGVPPIAHRLSAPPAPRTSLSGPEGREGPSVPNPMR